MKLMYKKPETEAISIEMTSTICSASKVGFGSGAANGSNPNLAPKRGGINNY